MKNLLLAFLLLPCFASAQVLFEKSWSSDFDFFVNDIAIDDLDNAYFACSGYNANIDSSVSVVVKTNADFEIQWSNWYRTLKRDDLGSIEILADGNVLIGGTMRQDFALDEGGGLIKIDSDGNVLWQKVIAGSFEERVIHTSELNSGEIVSVVRYGVFNQPSSVVTTDALGGISDRYEVFEGSAGIQLDDVVRGADGTFYATGLVFDINLSRNLVFITAFSNTENFWMRKYDFGASAQGSSISVNSNGDIAVGGLIVDPESVFNGNNGIVLVTDNLGEPIYSNRIYREGNGFSEFTSGVSWQGNGNLLVSMNFITDVGSRPLLAEFDSAGLLTWSTSIENGEGTRSSYVATLSDGRLITAGHSINGDIILNALIDEGQVACNEAPDELDLEELTPVTLTGTLTFSPALTQSIELPIEVIPWPMEETEICSLIVSTNDQSNQSGITIYPNPAKEEVAMEIPEGFNFLEVFSAEGMSVIFKTLVVGTTHFEVDDLPKGIYILQFSGTRGSEVHRLVVH